MATQFTFEFESAPFSETCTRCKLITGVAEHYLKNKLKDKSGEVNIFAETING